MSSSLLKSHGYYRHFLLLWHDFASTMLWLGIYLDIDDQTKENDDSDDLGDPIVQNEVQCFMSVFQDPKLAGLVPLEDLISTFEVLHIEELKPISSEHLSFELLD